MRLTALVHFPYRPARTPLPAPPEGLRTRLSEVTRPVADQFLRDQALALSKSDAVASLRRTRRNPRLFLSELAAIVRDRPVVLKDAIVGDEFVIRGLTVGEGPMRALELRLERGFFRVAEVLMARAGGCHRFEVRGRSPIVGIEAELPLPAVDDPFRQDDAPCVVDRDGGGVTVLRPPAVKTAPRGRAPAPARGHALVAPARHGPRRRVLRPAPDHRPGVPGRRRRPRARQRRGRARSPSTTSSPSWPATASSSLRPGPLRRVSRSAARAVLPAPTGEGTPITFALKRAAVGDVLAVIAEADPACPAAPARRRRAASASGPARPTWPTSARPSCRWRAWPGRPAATATRLPARPPSTERRLLVRADELSMSEFQLAGVASAGQGWTAFAYAPTGVLNAYKRGDRLADGTTTEVQSTDVMITTEEGPLRIALPEPGR